MQLEFIKGGPLTTIQDKGRIGFQQYGVIVSGAMDPVSLQLGNMLVGNTPEEGALEMTLSGPVLKVPAGMIFALTGAEMNARLGNQPVHRNKPIYVKTDSLLRFGFAAKGTRAYMAVAGGFDIPLVMNSKSTYLRAKMGGFKGRPLTDGDILPVGRLSEKQQRLIEQIRQTKEKKDSCFSTVPWSVENDFIFDESPIRVTEGLQYDWFTEDSLRAFFSSPYTISTNADRMGYRTQGATLSFKEKKDLISEPINLGAIQVPPDGNPIVLMADRQTTGGYPKIAQVILADIPRLAQMKPGQNIYFKKVTMKNAEEAYVKGKDYLSFIQKNLEKMLSL